MSGGGAVGDHSYFWTVSLGLVVVALSTGLLTSSVTPFMPSLKPRRPSPRPLPSSGSFLPPKRTKTTIARTMRCVGVKSSPIPNFSLAAGTPESTGRIAALYCRTAEAQRDTAREARQDGERRYILEEHGKLQEWMFGDEDSGSSIA